MTGGADARVRLIADLGFFKMRAAAAVILAICSTWLFSQPALAGKRVALVLGNSAYQNVSLINSAFFV